MRDPVEYLHVALRTSPLERPHEILAARAMFHGTARHVAAGIGPGATPAMLRVDAPDRHEVAQEFETLRERFWDLTAREFDEHAAALEVSGFPDLAVALTRLREVSTLRADVSATAVAAKIDAVFLSVLRQVLVAAPRDAIGLRDGFSKLLESGRPIRSVHRTIKLIRRKYPRVFERESVWMKFLLRFQKERKLRTQAVSKSWIWVLLFFSITAILRLIRLL